MRKLVVHESEIKVTKFTQVSDFITYKLIQAGFDVDKPIKISFNPKTRNYIYRQKIKKIKGIK